VVEWGVKIRQDVGLEITREDELAWAGFNYGSRSNRDFIDRFFDFLRAEAILVLWSRNFVTC
jgi:hypothetical protein